MAERQQAAGQGLTFNTSYTFSKSIDNNSVGSSNPQAQNFRNLAAERALSDFDARKRFVLSGMYVLPFKADGAFTSRLAEGWTMSPIVNLQSGSPVQPDHCGHRHQGAWRRSTVHPSCSACRCTCRTLRPRAI